MSRRARIAPLQRACTHKATWATLPLLLLVMGMGPCGPDHDDMGRPEDMASQGPQDLPPPSDAPPRGDLAAAGDLPPGGTFTLSVTVKSTAFCGDRPVQSSVYSVPLGISCVSPALVWTGSTTCTAEFPAGTEVKLRSGSGLAKWTGPCSSSDTSSCTVTGAAGARVSISAITDLSNTLTVWVHQVKSGAAVDITPRGNPNYRPNALTLCGIGGAGDKICCGAYTAGTRVEITDYPVNTGTLSQWGGACSGSASRCTVFVTGNMDVSVTYR